MVLERAARMAESAPSKADNAEQLQAGMRLAARFMNGEDLDLTAELSGVAPENRNVFRIGMAKTLLRNVVLPRDEELQHTAEKALSGIISLDAGQQTQTICKELGQILGQYNQHKTQATQQLDDAIINQLQQQAMASGQPAQEKINPAMHPQYREELNRVIVGLNNQYTQAMDQRKEVILQQITN